MVHMYVMSVTLALATLHTEPCEFGHSLHHTHNALHAHSPPLHYTHTQCIALTHSLPIHTHTHTHNALHTHTMLCTHTLSPDTHTHTYTMHHTHARTQDGAMKSVQATLSSNKEAFMERIKSRASTPEVCMCVCECVRVCVYVCECVYVCVSVCVVFMERIKSRASTPEVRICEHVCMSGLQPPLSFPHTHTHAYTHTHTHTHTHTQLPDSEHALRRDAALVCNNDYSAVECWEPPYATLTTQLNRPAPAVMASSFHVRVCVCVCVCV
jgi:hypothetical protein